MCWSASAHASNDRVVGDVKKFCPHAKIVHIDIDPSSISKTVKVDVPIVGPVGSVLREMNNDVVHDQPAPRRGGAR